MDLNRTANSRTELDAFPGIADPSARVWLAQNGSHLAPETLVAIYRRSRNAALDLAEAAARLLFGSPQDNGTVSGGHCEANIRRMGLRFGQWYDLDNQNEFRAKCLDRLVREICAGTDEKPFWEERFYHALKLLAFDVGRSMVQRRNSTITEVDLDSFESGAEPKHPALAVESDVFSRLERTEVEEAIRALPDGIRQCAWLRWVEEWPIESSNSAEMTIASALGVTARTVRNRLIAAREELQNDPRISPSST